MKTLEQILLDKIAFILANIPVCELSKIEYEIAQILERNDYLINKNDTFKIK